MSSQVRFLICCGAVFLASVFLSRAAESGLSPALIERCKAATALVDLGKEGSGSGFLIDSSGLFATNHHVVEGLAPNATVKLVLNPGATNQYTVQARVAVISGDDDLALLKTDEPIKAAPLTLSDDQGLVELTPIVVFGYPFGKMLSTGNDTYPAADANNNRPRKVSHLTLFLDGEQVATGEGQAIAAHAPMMFGATPKATQICYDEPSNATAKDHPFSGLMDEVIIYNSQLSPRTIKIFAGGNFECPAAGER